MAVRRSENAKLRRRVTELERAAGTEKATTDRAVETIQRLTDEKSQAQALARLANVPPGAERPALFPSDAPAAFQPARFRDLAQAAATQCGMQLSLEQVECSEYPCIAVFRQGSGPQATRFSPGDCPPWHDAFGDMTMVNLQFFDDGGLQGMTWIPVPPGDSKAALFRSRERLKHLLGAP